MMPKSERKEIHTNYINGFLNNSNNIPENSNLENTNNPLIANNNNNIDSLLNKK